MSVPAAWLRCSGSVCERCVCVSGGGGIIASREAAGTLPRREPMTLKSCAPRLPNNRPEIRHLSLLPQAWAPSLLSALSGLRQWGLLGDNRGKKSTSFTFQVPQSSSSTSPPPPPPSSPSQHKAGTSRLTLICTSKPQQSLTFHPSADTNDLSRWALTSLTTGKAPH